MDRFRTGELEVSRAAERALRELGGGEPMTSADRFAVYLFVSANFSVSMDQEDWPLRVGLVKIMESIDPRWTDGENMGDHWLDWVHRDHDHDLHPDALRWLYAIVARSGAAEDMVRAIVAGLGVLRNGGHLSDAQVDRLSSCWRWEPRGVSCQAVDALLAAIRLRRSRWARDAWNIPAGSGDTSS